MKQIQDLIIVILLSSLLILFRYLFVEFLNKHITDSRLPYFGIISLLIVLFLIYRVHTDTEIKNILTNVDSISLDEKNIIINQSWFENMIKYLHIIFLIIFTYTAFTKNKNSWNVLFYETIISLISLIIMIRDNL
jgi:hypothetical protein